MRRGSAPFLGVWDVGLRVVHPEAFRFAQTGLSDTYLYQTGLLGSTTWR